MLLAAVVSEQCDMCDCCDVVCPTNAIDIVMQKWHLRENECIGCEKCILSCPNGALYMKEK